MNEGWTVETFAFNFEVRKHWKLWNHIHTTDLGAIMKMCTDYFVEMYRSLTALFPDGAIISHC